MEALGWVLSIFGALMIVMGIFASASGLRSLNDFGKHEDNPVFAHHARVANKHPRASLIFSGLFLLSFGLHFLGYIENPIYIVLRLIDMIFGR